MAEPMKPKVCFVHGSLGLGGAEVLRISILKEMVARDADVHVVTTREAGELADAVRDLGVPLTELGSRGGLMDVPGVRRLSKFLKNLKPDLVQSSQFLTNFHSRLACQWAGVKNHIIEEHGIYTWKKGRHLTLDRWFNANAQGVIACSAKVAESAAGQLRVPIEKIDVVHNCVSREHLKPLPESWHDSTARAQLRRELVQSDFTPAHITAIVGTLRWEKGHRFLLDAWEALSGVGVITSEHHLLIVGDGPLRSELETRSRNLTNVTLLGSIADTRKILSASDLFVLPSVNEGFGIAIIEAMAAGLPVVSTSSGGIPEVVTEGTGLLVEPNNSEALAIAIRSCLTGTIDTHAMGLAGRKRVESHFTPGVYVDQLEAIYKRLLS